MTSITIDRTSLTLDPLVIGESCSAATGFWLGQDGTNPSFAPRYTYAPESRWVSGQKLLSVVKEASTLEFVVYMRATTDVDLVLLKSELEDALWQFSYTVTLDHGYTETWDADPTTPVWGPWVYAHEKLHVARAGVVIPINPAS